MTIAPDLSAALGKAAPADPLQVVFTLDPARLVPTAGGTTTGGSGPVDVAAKRAAFAAAAQKAIAEAIDQASAASGHQPQETTLFDNLGSAWLRAPAALVSKLADNPAVASIGLNQGGSADNGGT